MSPLAIVLVVAAAGLFGGGIMMMGGDRAASDPLQRLRSFGGLPDRDGGAGEAIAPTGAPREVLGRLLAPITGLLDRTGKRAKTANQLATANLKLTPAEWLAAQVAGIAGLGSIVYLRSQSLIGLAVGGVAAWFLFGLILKFLQRRRRKAFERQLADTMILISNALKAGYSFAQAMAKVSEHGNPPIAEEFLRATREIAVGIPIDAALKHMEERNQSEDFALMLTAVSITQVSGGNLAVILETIAHTIRERVRIKGEIATLTAQARASGWIIVLLPFALSGFLYLISPSYFVVLFDRTLGRVMLAVGMVMMLIGFAIIQKISKVEV